MNEYAVEIRSYEELMWRKDIPPSIVAVLPIGEFLIIFQPHALITPYLDYYITFFTNSQKKGGDLTPPNYLL